MNAYTVLLIMIGCQIEARPNDFWPNVGSVLFNRDDLNRIMWSKRDIALLKARRYFQKLIPPPTFITVENEFVDKMLTYFRDTYATIKNVSPDQDVDRIMTTALSDTVGGYLKLCVLPVTKLSFYGGIASYESAYKVFRFYTEIKEYLYTDGHNWRNPDQKMLNDLILNGPKVWRNKKQMLNAHDLTQKEDPCTLFYFEKSPKGLVVPIPVVNWDDVSMFLPVHNESTFSLDSPKHCNTLQNYYNKAKICMNSKSKDVAADFDYKFQNWLSSDVLPHLKDDRLYVALGNVLSLLNQTREICDVILDIYNSSSKRILPDLKSIVCSKTSIVVIIILIFEIIWCIVAIDRLCCKKISDLDDMDNNNSHRVFSYFRICSNKERMPVKNRNTQDYETKYPEMAINKSSYMRKWSGHSNYTEMDRKINWLPTTVEAGCQNEPSIKCECPSTCIGTKCRAQCSFLYQVQSNDILTIVNERIDDFSSPSPRLPMTITNKSYTKIPSNISGVKDIDTRETYTCNSINLYDESSSTIARTKNKSAVTIYRSQKSSEGNQTRYRSRQRKNFQIEKAVTGCKRNKAILSPYSIIPDSRPSRNSAADSYVSFELVNIPSINEVTTDSPICYYSHEKPSTITKKARTISEMQSVTTRPNNETETNVQERNYLVNKLTSPVAVMVSKDLKGKQFQWKRYLKMKIDEPKAEIKLGTFAARESPRKGQSKIPTRKSVKRAQYSTIKRPKEVTTESLVYADKSIDPVTKYIDRSTDYIITQEYAMHQVSTKEDNSHVINHNQQNQVKNYRVLESTLLSTQDLTTIPTASKPDIRFEEKNANTKSNEQDKSLMTIKRSGSDSSKISRYTADVALPCTNLKQDTIIESSNNARGTHQETVLATEKVVWSVLATEKEKTLKEQNVRESSDIVTDSTNGSESKKKGHYSLNKWQAKTTENSNSSLKLIKTNTKSETSKVSKYQKITEPMKKLNKQERRAGTVKSKITKCHKDNPRKTLRPPVRSLSKWKTSMELEGKQNCKQRNEFAPTTENVIEKSSILLNKSDTYGDTTCKRQTGDGSNGQTNLSTTRKSKIPQLKRIDDTRVTKTLNTEVRLNLSF
ncbi:uncharacterized protein LOC113234935 [Hyposmocoma kahamanoa]|uniref:uncharacterized protein LOC113234935 n=1 Tax=Hyposmocoma kahamanoa TaxID=1477025 RepID=UPI000E6D77D8|nr:uncharacterized protein LOC113234935 [Hyposmocoma kahamanoa]